MAETVRLVHEQMFGYTAGSFGLLAIAVALAFVPAVAPRVAVPSPLRSAGVFFLAIAAAIVAFRWPILSMNDAVQGDESALIVMAQTALHHPVPWESFDSSTSGPLNVLALAPIVGLLSNGVYFGTRLFACALAVAGLFLLYRCGKELYGELAGRTMISRGGVLLRRHVDDLTPYTSEAVANVLVAAAGLLVVRIALSDVGVARAGDWGGPPSASSRSRNFKRCRSRARSSFCAHLRCGRSRKERGRWRSSAPEPSFRS